MPGNFTYVRIPADEALPLVELVASKEGGLTDDALLKEAKEYFRQQQQQQQQPGGNAAANKERLDRAPPEERKAWAQEIREKLQASSNKLDHLDDDALLNLALNMGASTSCDITAVTVPTAGNEYQAVSLYAAANAPGDQSVNARAARLLTACGHAPRPQPIRGDVFVGRCYDHESSQEEDWERRDFTAADADPGADWCAVARKAGGGGGQGAGAGASLSGLLQQQQGGSGGGLQVLDNSAAAAGTETTADGYGYQGAPPVQEKWGTWTQDEDTVELVFAVPPGTRAKACQVQFARKTLSVTVSGQMLLEKGTLFDPVVTDECTFTLQDAGASGRELCVSLAKANAGTVWPYVAQSR